MKEEHFATLKEYVDRVRVETGTLKQVQNRFPDETFTRYVLLDHQDWLSTEDILDEWDVFFNKCVQGKTYVLWRSFSEMQHLHCLKYLKFEIPSSQILNIVEESTGYVDRVGMYNSTHYARIPSKDEKFSIVRRSIYQPDATYMDDMNVMC